MTEENFSLFILSDTDSTNNYANRLITEGKAKNGSVVLSHYQTNGRGQRGNTWESAPGKNLLASIVLFPKFLPPGKQFYLSKIASLALYDLLVKHTQGVTVKWPNDIYVGNKKIAGILIETSILGNQFHSAVVGIGLNLNQEIFSEELPNPVSLKLLTGKDYDIKETALNFRGFFMKWYQKLETWNIAEIDAAYHEYLFRIKEWSVFQKNDKRFEARILGTGEYGQLILEDRTGNQTFYMFKEIEFVT
ncbi:biotin--[acetyl-CoA-carboxylase] ligase [Mariniphaga sp.]|uniref:biotin--[acetyl-CoA-carboxylase] ligase n=1 Tax=Mariniphaga sp. TaxID=1954475 RepID=UPI0035658588